MTANVETLEIIVEPVYGPERPAAALASIAELAAAKAPLTGWSDYDTPTMRYRYRHALATRALYSEYGPSFDEHADEMFTGAECRH